MTESLSHIQRAVDEKRHDKKQIFEEMISLSPFVLADSAV
jgi:hypothetical protein